MNKLSIYKKDLKKYGTILIPKSQSFIFEDDFKKIEKNLKKIPTEFVKNWRCWRKKSCSCK